MTVGSRIAKCRKDKNISQEQLAEMMNVSRQTVSKWETGGAQPDTYNIIQLGEILGTSVEYLACGGDSAEKVVTQSKNSCSTTIEDNICEQEKERLDKRKFWGFVLLMLGTICLVRFFNPDAAYIEFSSATWWIKLLEGLILTIPCLFGIKMLVDKR